LGVIWNIEDDTFIFKVKIADKLNILGILFIVSSIFDPLGFMSTITLRVKAIIQKLCKVKTESDDEIPSKYREEWQKGLCLDKKNRSAAYFV
jgi:hypothetical protein